MKLSLSFVTFVGAGFALLLTGCQAEVGRPQLPATQDTSSLHARFFGVSTILLDDGKDSILIDGFFSRPGLFSFAANRPPNGERICHGMKDVRNLRAVLVAHSHHDHVMDSGVVASLRPGARLHGSHKVAQIAAKDLPKDRIDTLCDGKTQQHGEFKIHFIRTPHAPEPFLTRILMSLRFLPGVGAFPGCENYAFHVTHPTAKILIMPSAALPEKGLPPLSADVVFLGVAYLDHQGKDAICQYWEQCVVQTGAKVVIPIHWDNLFNPADKKLTSIPCPFDNIPQTLATLQKLADRDKKKIVFMPLNDAVTMPPAL